MIDGLIDAVRSNIPPCRGRVLVAEGDGIIRRRIMEGLMNAGISSVEAPTHQNALALLWTDQSIDVIITDSRLPGGSGARLVHAAQAALGREFGSIILAPMGEIPGQMTIDPSDVVTVVSAAIERLNEVSTRRLRKSGDDVKAPTPLDATSEATFECLAVAAEHKDNETGRHNRRIGIYAKVIAEALGWSAERQNMIEIAAKLHDIGKIGIPDNILFKCGALTGEERTAMQQHTSIGHHILSAATNPTLACAARIAQHHHQHWCGTGYPGGLKGLDIPIEARATAICDVYDALRSERPYKTSFTHDQAIGIILNGDGRTRPEHFDPDILAVLSSVEASFKTIFSTMTGP